MFEWLFGKPRQERRLERDEIKAAADDEVWLLRKKADALMATIEATVRSHVEGKSK